jgi:DNA-directed RNA polymerase II subunit RPB2
MGHVDEDAHLYQQQLREKMISGASGGASTCSPISPDDFQTYTWKFLNDYFRNNGSCTIVKHQIDSYNDFILRKIDQIVEGFNPIEVHHRFLPDLGIFQHVLSITVENLVISKPTINEKDGSTKVMMPNDARLRNLTYSATLYVDVNVTGKTYDADLGEYVSESKKITGVSLGKIPIMVRSAYCMLSQPCSRVANSTDECRNDYGGYFIVNGNEKVIISQDRIAENKTYVFTSTKVSSYSLVAEIRSVQENRFGVPKTTTLKLTSKGTQFGRQIRVNIHHVRQDVPLFIMFRALGVESDLDIVRIVVHDLEDPVGKLVAQELVGSMDESSGVTCTRDAMEYLSKYLHAHGHPKELAGDPAYRVSIIREVLATEFLPHTGTGFASKALYLGYMVNKLLRCYLGVWDMDDRDSYVNKRLDTPGVCLANLFRQYYGKVVKDMKNTVQKDINSGAWRSTAKFVNVVNKHNIYKVIKSTVIESGLKYGLATGNWGMKSTRMRQGVAQVLNRMTYMATLSHLRRVTTPIEKTGKLVQPRKLHSTQWGVVCPSETPEGQSIGLVKNLAITCTITIAAVSDYVRVMLPVYGMIPFEGFEGFDLSLFCRGGTKVFVNGDIVGVHMRPHDLHTRLRQLKRSGAISVHTSISWYVLRNELSISTEGGRCVRPLYIVDPGNRVRLDRDTLRAFDAGRIKSWSDLVMDSMANAGTKDEDERVSGYRPSVIEYMDVEEANCSMIAMKYSDVQQHKRSSDATCHASDFSHDANPDPCDALEAAIVAGQTVCDHDTHHAPARYTHLEMDPSLMLGAMAGSIPFSDHNQAPRNTYQSAMGKQAIGLYATNFRNRYDTMAFVLDYPQRPLVTTQVAKIINCNKALCGINAVVAIATYTGFNQEDSIIVNRSAVERDMLSSTFYRTYKEQKNKNHSSGEEEVFCRADPGKTRGMKPFNYNKLNTDGFVPEDTYVEAGDVVIGKCMPQKVGTSINYKDTSVVLKNNERGYVDKNAYGNKYFTNVNGDGYSFCKVRTRTERVPTIGDKFSCYTPDHQVLTSEGWVGVADLTFEHSLATRVRVGATSLFRTVYQYPIALQSYPYSGPMYRVCTPLRSRKKSNLIAPDAVASTEDLPYDRVVDLCVTPNHRMFVSDGLTGDESEWTMVRADDLESFAARSGGIYHVEVHDPGDDECEEWSRIVEVEVGTQCYWEVYTGSVHCCTVPEGEGVVCVRRVGRCPDAESNIYSASVWCGQSRHGQKGTMGMMYKQEDMPFTASGIVPDIIINPHAIPSRMTIGQLMECIMGKACCGMGAYGDSTPFTDVSVDDIAERVESCGMERHGNEIMYNSRTGEQIEVAIFIGPTYYQRLKHMVEDKLHSRSNNGPVVMLTRQPAEGRARDGGLRIGEMEIECNWAHGVMHFLKERFMECSDNYRVFVCKECGMMATVNPERNIYRCNACQNSTHFAEVRIPYACKLLLQEIQTMGIGTRILT